MITTTTITSNKSPTANNKTAPNQLTSLIAQKAKAVDLISQATATEVADHPENHAPQVENHLVPLNHLAHLDHLNLAVQAEAQDQAAPANHLDHHAVQERAAAAAPVHAPTSITTVTGLMDSAKRTRFSPKLYQPRKLTMLKQPQLLSHTLKPNKDMSQSREHASLKRHSMSQ